jgi:ParB family chromosome partitioning protein
MKRKALGRGLDSLIPTKAAPPKVAAESPGTTVPVGSIVPNPHQPRKVFAEEEIRELAASIRVDGLLQPIVVCRRGDQHVLIAGERRWRAMQSLGWTDIPAVVKEVADDREMLVLALVENVQREDLNPIERALGYRELQQKFHLTQEEIAAKMGKSRAVIANGLRLLNLPEEIQTLVQAGKLSEGHARSLLALDGEKAMLRMARRIVDAGMSVRQTEQGTRKGREIDADTKDAEQKLARALHAPVAILRRRKGGYIRIQFHSEEELIRLFETLQGSER